MSKIEYALEVLNDEIKDQRHILKTGYVNEERKWEFEQRIEQLKTGIKILKEYEEER